MKYKHRQNRREIKLKEFNNLYKTGQEKLLNFDVLSFFYFYFFWKLHLFDLIWCDSFQIAIFSNVLPCFQSMFSDWFVLHLHWKSLMLQRHALVQMNIKENCIQAIFELNNWHFGPNCSPCHFNSFKST